MKTLFHAVTITSALACASLAVAQDEPQTTPSPPPPVAIIHDVQNATEGALHQVQNGIEKQMLNGPERMLNDFKNRVFSIRRGSAKTERSLVVRSSDMAPRAQSDLEEDLTIMTHLLDKTLGERFTEDQAERLAMGINVSFVPGGVPTRSVYLDGYGALFFLTVNFPLLPTPTDKNVEKEKSSTDSAWEEAREEVYGRPTAKSWTSGPEYDSAKVATLKGALLDSLKNASNIRSVKSDESITVCVIGGSSRAPMRVVTSSGGGGGLQTFGASAGGGDEAGQNVWFTTSGSDDASEIKTTMTIRVKKSDCEAFANGKMTADEFRKKAVINVYGEPAGEAAVGHDSGAP